VCDVARERHSRGGEDRVTPGHRSFVGLGDHRSSAMARSIRFSGTADARRLFCTINWHRDRHEVNAGETRDALQKRVGTSPRHVPLCGSAIYDSGLDNASTGYDRWALMCPACLRAASRYNENLWRRSTRESPYATWV